MAPTPVIGKPRCVAREFDADAFGRVAVGFVVDLHRAAGQPEHRQRNRGKCKMVIQHHAEEARDQDLVGQRGGGQHENREIMAAWNSGKGCKTLLLNELFGALFRFLCEKAGNFLTSRCTGRAKTRFFARCRA